jgi:predicted dehydrogenase
MDPKPVRLALVGCGGMGNGHLKILAKREEVQLVACCDIEEQKARQAGETYGCDWYTEYEKMLARDDIDAVDVVTWSGNHAELGTLAAESGRHVLTEKPIDLDLRKIDRLIETCDRKKLKLGCIFQSRFGPQNRQVKQAIDEGKLGRILSCSGYIKWYRAQSYYDRAAWAGTWALDGGCLANQSIHTIDQMVWMAGPVAKCVYCNLQTKLHNMEAEDFAIAVVKFENDAVGVIEATTCAAPDGLPGGIQIFGSKGSAAVGGGQFVLKYEGMEQEPKPEEKPAEEGTHGRRDPLAIGLGGHEAQILDFVQAIQYGGEPFVTGRAARVAVDCLTKIYDRHRKGR